MEKSVGEGGRINISRGGGGTTGLEKARKKPRLEIRAGINVTEKEQRKYDKSDFLKGIVSRKDVRGGGKTKSQL